VTVTAGRWWRRIADTNLFIARATTTTTTQRLSNCRRRATEKLPTDQIGSETKTRVIFKLAVRWDRQVYSGDDSREATVKVAASLPRIMTLR